MRFVIPYKGFDTDPKHAPYNILPSDLTELIDEKPEGIIVIFTEPFTGRILQFLPADLAPVQELPGMITNFFRRYGFTRK